MRTQASTFTKLTIKLEPSHLDSPVLQHEKISYLATAQQLDGLLMEILIQELTAGNRIYEAAECNNECWVMLTQPFSRAYPATNSLHCDSEPNPHDNSVRY